MKSGTTKKLLILLYVIIYIVTGFFREYIFLNINEQSRVTFYHADDSHLAKGMQWISGFSYSTLYYSKWILTFLFTVFFAFLATLIIRNSFEEKRFVRITWLAYGATFGLGLLFYLAGSLSGNSQTTYDIARFLAGLTETPGMLVILAAFFLAIRRN